MTGNSGGPETVAAMCTITSLVAGSPPVQISGTVLASFPLFPKRSTNKTHFKPISQKPRKNTAKMPLVVPGITSNSGDKTEEWTNKLVGKKLADKPSNETVSTSLPSRLLDRTLIARSLWPDLLQDRTPAADSYNRARHDGH